MRKDTALKYLGKSDIDKSFKKLQKEEIEFVETDYNKCCEIIKNLTEDILSKYKDYITVYEGNLQDLTRQYKTDYIAYLKKEEKERKDNPYSVNSYFYREPKSEEKYIETEIKYNYGSSAMRFKKYMPTKKEEQKVLYFELEKHYDARSKFSFNFCAYYNSENIFCLDKITFEKLRRGWEQNILEIETAKTSPDKIIELLERFLQLNAKGEENYKKGQVKLKKDKIKKAKVTQLKRKAGVINIKKILDEIDCSYEIEEMNSAMKIHISLDKGITTIKIPKKNLNESLQYLEEFVETILKASQLKIYFKHLQY